MTTTPVRIYFVRHGETEWTISGQHTGRTDIPLTARGEQESSWLCQRLKDIPFAHKFTSPRVRARRTCEMAGLSPLAEIAPDLAEWDYGDYEGARSVDIRRIRSDWNIFRDGCPNGETPSQISARADRLIARLRALNGNIALFSHGQFGCVLAARWIALPVAHARNLSLSTASLSILGSDPRHSDVPVIALWNAISPEATARDERERNG
jgi:probable phosphoglycerate mutase